VSHDSQDLKIFSYIACDSGAVFRCHVFKAYRKVCLCHNLHSLEVITQLFSLSACISSPNVDTARGVAKGSCQQRA